MGHLNWEIWDLFGTTSVQSRSRGHECQGQGLDRQEDGQGHKQPIASK